MNRDNYLCITKTIDVPRNLPQPANKRQGGRFFRQIRLITGQAWASTPARSPLPSSRDVSAMSDMGGFSRICFTGDRGARADGLSSSSRNPDAPAQTTARLTATPRLSRHHALHLPQNDMVALYVKLRTSRVAGVLTRSVLNGF